MEPLTVEQQETALANDGLARKYGSVYARRYGLDIDDCIQCARLGLLRAVQKYDVSQGFTFATYAMHWIKAKLLKYTQENHSIVQYKHAFWTTDVSKDLSLDYESDTGMTMLENQVDDSPLPGTELEVNDERVKMEELLAKFIAPLTPEMRAILFEFLYSDNPVPMKELGARFSLSVSHMNARKAKLVRMLRHYFTKNGVFSMSF